MIDVPLKPIMNVHEVAEYLRVNPRSVRVWLSEGKIKHFRAGRLVRIHRDALMKFIEGNNCPLEGATIACTR